jgi:hypothetical protein
MQLFKGLHPHAPVEKTGGGNFPPARFKAEFQESRGHAPDPARLRRILPPPSFRAAASWLKLFGARTAQADPSASNLCMGSKGGQPRSKMNSSLAERPFSECGSRRLSAMALPSAGKGSISAPAATWLHMPRMIEACAAGAPFSDTWHPNAAPGASAEGGAIPLPSYAETLQPLHVWKYPLQPGLTATSSNRSNASHFILAPASRKDCRAASKSASSQAKILRIFAEMDVRARDAAVRAGRSNGGLPLFRAESAGFIPACSKKSSSGRISAAFLMHSASGARSPPP